MADNLSFYAIPAAWLVAIAPKWYGGYLTAASKDLKFYDNSAPREFLARVRAQEKQSPDSGKYLRAEAASANGHENLPIFAAAVIAGNVAGLPSSTLNLLSAFYLGTRVVYNWVYIRSTSRKWGALRSGTYMLGLFTCLGLFIKSGNAVRQVGLLRR